VGIGCRGCYGPGEGVEDIGARLTAALASVVDSGTATQQPDQLAAEVETAMASVVDPAGTLYRYAMAHALRQAGRLGPGGPAGTVGHDAHRL
jgi:F420-non-reducing hydrogenase small subunit